MMQIAEQSSFYFLRNTLCKLIRFMVLCTHRSITDKKNTLSLPDTEILPRIGDARGCGGGGDGEVVVTGGGGGGDGSCGGGRGV